MFEWGISSISFSGGETIDVERGSMLILIGPNNSGKSRALREIEEGLLINGNRSDGVVQMVFKFINGNEQDFHEWISTRFSSRIRNGIKIYSTKGAHIPESSTADVFEKLQRSIENESSNSNFHNMPFISELSNFARFFWERLDTQTRLSLVGPAQLINPFFGDASQYIHLLQSDEALMKTVSSEFQKAFGEDLIINWYGENNVYFHIGKEPERTVEKDRVSPEYQAELAKLPKLHEEGDGVKSFTGTLLAAVCGAHPVILIDEPEAFLHPKQAERLGGILASSAERLNRQVIVATHSSAFVRGAVNKSSRVSVCRITRNRKRSLNNASVLSSDGLKNLWSSPLLRSTSAIEGVFNRGVVVCEADTDCRFYESILGHLESKNIISSPADLHFVHGSGKGKIATLANSYKRLDVAVAVIADLDLMRDTNEFKAVYNAIGGDFKVVESFYKQSLQALNDVKPIMSIAQFVHEAGDIIASANQTGELGKEDRRKLLEMLDHTVRWSDAKRYGINKLKGQPRQILKNLLQECQKVGLFLVPTGELESWWLDGPAEKKEWLTPAVEQVLSDNPDLDEAKNFVVSVYNYISQYTS